MNWTKEELNKFTDDFNHWLYDIYFVMSTLDRYTVANCLGVISSTLMLISMFIGKFEGPSFIYQKAVAIFNSAMFFVIFFRILADRGKLAHINKYK